MYLTAWLIGDEAESILNDLMEPDGYPPAVTWVPLESAAPSPGTQMPQYRSAWGVRMTDGAQWIDYAIPPDTVAAYVGPQALVHPKTLATGRALVSNVELHQGEFMVKVPRYFGTFGTHWTYEQVGRNPLVTRAGEDTSITSMGALDLDKSFRAFGDEPPLLIDANGPQLFAWRRDTYYNASTSRSAREVLNDLTQLATDTPIRCAWCAFPK